MIAPVALTPKQQRFLTQACAFIATNPPQAELNKLLTLAAMLLPPPAIEMLEKRAAAAGSPCTDDPPTHLLQ